MAFTSKYSGTEIESAIPVDLSQYISYYIPTKTFSFSMSNMPSIISVLSNKKGTYATCTPVIIKAYTQTNTTGSIIGTLISPNYPFGFLGNLTSGTALILTILCENTIAQFTISPSGSSLKTYTIPLA